MVENAISKSGAQSDDWLPAQVLRLDDEVTSEKLTVRERVELSDAEMRKDVVKNLTSFFIKVNGFVIGGIFVMYVIDMILLFSGREPIKIINTDVILAIIGGTTVQLGALMIIMGKYLFPPK